jgi:hypothetical protein
MGHGAAPAAAADPAHAGMDHGGAEKDAHPASDAERLREVHARMMADPVIRARVAADSVLRRMMAELHGAGDAVSAAGDTAQAVDFIVRLLSDPDVEARIHADPQLHRLWSDPEVQRRVAELRRRSAAEAAAPPHRH